jgi:DNA-binding Lrp family transcriptional regulator
MNITLSEAQSMALRRLLETGLPLTPRPFQALAEQIEASEAQVLDQMRLWHEQGLFRRVGLVVNHRALGFCAMKSGDALAKPRASTFATNVHGACRSGNTTCSA